MAINLTLNRIVLVKEKSARYDLPRSISSPRDVRNAVQTVMHLEDEAQEVFGAIFVNMKNNIIGIHELSRGSLNASIVSPRDVFKTALLHNAAGMILFHNHPSGNVINDFLQKQLERGICNSTVSKYKTLVSGILQLAVSENIIVQNPVQGSMKIKKKKPQTNYIKEEDMKRIIEAAECITAGIIAGKRQGSNLRCLYPIILTAYHTGMRINEVLALRWGNIDFEKNMIKVCENLSEAKDEEGKIRLIVVPPKTEESVRNISISTTLSKVLKELRCEQEAKEQIVFCSEAGRYIASSNFSRVWRKLLMELALKGEYRFHEIRHTHATELIGGGYSIKDVSVRLGHADVQTTLNSYAHALPKQDKEIAAYFDERC